MAGKDVIAIVAHKENIGRRKIVVLNNTFDKERFTLTEPIQEILKKRGGASIVLCDAGITLRRAETFELEEWALLVNAMM